MRRSRMRFSMPREFAFGICRSGQKSCSEQPYAANEGIPLRRRSMSVDFSIAWKTGFKIMNEIIALLPNITLGVLILIVFLIAASFAKSRARRIALRRLSHQGVALLLARLVHTCVAALRFLISVSVIAPSFQAADLIKVLGIGT